MSWSRPGSGSAMTKFCGSGFAYDQCGSTSLPTTPTFCRAITGPSFLSHLKIPSDELFTTFDKLLLHFFCQKKCIKGKIFMQNKKVREYLIIFILIFKKLLQYMFDYFLPWISYTVCPGSSDQFYIVTYYKKWVTTLGTDSITATWRYLRYY